MLLEDVNVVERSADAMLDHVFECHDELRRIRKELAEARHATDNTDRDAIVLLNELKIALSCDTDEFVSKAEDIGLRWAKQHRT